jgi:hypothetical protein
MTAELPEPFGGRLAGQHVGRVVENPLHEVLWLRPRPFLWSRAVYWLRFGWLCLPGRFFSWDQRWPMLAIVRVGSGCSDAGPVGPGVLPGRGAALAAADA